MKAIVYVTINRVNLKIYVGVHECEDPDKWDYYLGCGGYANKPSSYNKCETPFLNAIFKYGPSNFRRITLCVCDTMKEALRIEGEIVNEEFIKRSDTYNVALGGGKPPVSNKIVHQYDLNGNYLNTFNALYEASEKTGSYLEGIRNAIKLKRSCNNFYWSLEKVDNLDIEEYNETKYRSGLSAYSDSLDLIKEFNSVSEAVKFFDFDQALISRSMAVGYKCHGIYFVPNTLTLEQYMDRTKNYNRTCKTPVFSYDIKTGNFVKEYSSVKDACKDIGLKAHGPLIRAIKTNKTSGGYRWAYYKVDNILKNSVSTDPPKPKKVGRYDLSGNFIDSMDIKTCRKLYPNAIRVCLGSRKTAHGYIFKYIYQ